MAKVGNFNEVCKFISKIAQNGMLSGLIRLLGNGSTEIQRHSRCPQNIAGRRATAIAGGGDDCGQGGCWRYWVAGGLLIQVGEFIVEPGEEGLF